MPGLPFLLGSLLARGFKYKSMSIKPSLVDNHSFVAPQLQHASPYLATLPRIRESSAPPLEASTNAPGWLCISLHLKRWEWRRQQGFNVPPPPATPPNSLRHQLFEKKKGFCCEEIDVESVCLRFFKNPKSWAAESPSLVLVINDTKLLMPCV